MKILHLEDDPQDAERVAQILKKQFPEVEITSINQRKDFVSALSRGGFDVILCDFNLPELSGQEALELARETQPDVPFIFLAGTVGEETAVELVRQGAADYLLKDRIQRLPHAIQRARRDTEERLQRQEAEELIREQAELLDKTRDGIVVTDLSYRILYWNHGAGRIFGWSPEEVHGRSVLDLFGRGLEASVDTMEKHLVADEEWRGELSVNDKAGKAILIEIRITIIRNPLGQPKSCLAIIEDITERRKLEEQFFRAQRLESLGMLATGIAHDLNNALAPMLMAGEILHQRVTDPADRKLLDLFSRSGRRATAMVKQIVAFAKGGTREKVLIQTKHLLRDILQLMEETFPKSIRLEHQIPSGLWTVQGDASQLHQVLLNFCINARDAMPQGGTLRLTARNRMFTKEEAAAIPDATPGAFIAIEVSDTGTGIPAFVIEHIWQPFFTTKGEGKGTGLGLSTARGITVNHGGFVKVESEMGRGSAFQVFLPAAEVSESGAQADGSPRASASAGNGELVLIVDDEEGIRESVAAILRLNGYRPLTTSDGIEALAQYAGRIREVSLVISDLDMPGMGGAAFSKAVLLLNPTAKIMFISGATHSGLTENEGAGSDTTFLPKPFTAEVLLSTVKKVLGSENG